MFGSKDVKAAVLSTVRLEADTVEKLSAEASSVKNVPAGFWFTAQFAEAELMPIEAIAGKVGMDAKV